MGFRFSVALRLRDENLLESSLNFSRQRTEIGNSLQLIIRKLDVKVILQFGQQIERLQAIDFQGFEKIFVGMQFLPRHLEVCGGKTQYFVQRFFGSWHS